MRTLITNFFLIYHFKLQYLRRTACNFVISTNYKTLEDEKYFTICEYLVDFNLLNTTF